MTDNNDENQSSTLAEADSLTAIVRELSQHGHDARRRIIRSLLSFFDVGTTHSAATTGQSSNYSSPSTTHFSEDRSLSPKEFLMEKLPQTDVERVACLAFYLTHYRDQPNFKTFEITKLNTEAAQRKFANAAKAVSNATQYGYLAQATKGMKQLSAAGELFVQALPDRNAAREAMARIRPKRKSKGRAKQVSRGQE